jgi:uncharacterized protein involved in exopolysaccharide biosynthesis
MADLRSTYQVLKDRRKNLENALNEAGRQMTPPTTTPSKADPTDLLSPAALEAEYQKQKAAKKKKGWW